MKKIVFMAGIFFCFVTQALGQVEESIENVNKKEEHIKGDTNVTISPKQYDVLLQKINTISAVLEQNERDTVAKLYLKDTITVYQANASGRKVVVDRIYLTIREGFIYTIEVELEGFNKAFSNKRAPIGLTPRRFQSQNDRLYIDKNTTNNGYYIIAQELIRLKEWKSFLPEDLTIRYEPKSGETKKIFTLHRNSGINTLLDIRLYADALALFGEEENGLAQTEIKFKQLLHRSNFRNRYLFFAQYFRLNFNFAKFDSRYQYLNSDNFAKANLIRQQYINAEIALNLAHGAIGYKSSNRFYIDAGAGVGGVKVVQNVSDSISTTSTNLFLEVGSNFMIGGNAGIDVSFRPIRMFNPIIKEHFADLNSRFFNYLRYSGELYWNPFNDNNSKLFARINYIEPTQSFFKRDGFLQVQIGSSLLLSNLIKKK